MPSICIRKKKPLLRPTDSTDVAGDATQQIAFTIGVIVLGAKMAKADGAVTRHEVNAFKQVFHIPQDEMKNVGRIFDLARRDSQGWEPYAKQIAKLLADRPAVLEDLLDGLFHIARADGALHDAEIEYLHGIAKVFGFSDRDFDRIRACNGCAQKNDAYAVLGLTPAATDEEIKVDVPAARPRPSPRPADRPGAAAGLHRHRQRQAGGDQRSP